MVVVKVAILVRMQDETWEYGFRIVYHEKWLEDDAHQMIRARRTWDAHEAICSQFSRKKHATNRADTRGSSHFPAMHLFPARHVGEKEHF